MSKNAWDKSQLEIIEAPAGDRLLVEAGPGTGKTAVACARVAHLIEHEDISPSNIWLFSFTRTAVKEIRDRIVDYVSDRRLALAVRITTLDSRVWHLRQGFDEQDVSTLISGGYNLNIDRVTELLQEQSEDLLDYLEDIEHLVVDEAQDLVDARGRLVCELIKSLSPECGVTVFADSAQAIYGFTSEKGAGGASESFQAVPALRSSEWGTFTQVELKTVYRTKDKKLANAWEKLREHVLLIDGDPLEGYEGVRKAVESLAHGTVPAAEKQNLANRDDVLVLYRTRAQVLNASSWLWSAGVSHKLRMSGLPQRLTPWIARIFWDFTEGMISGDTFEALWDERVTPSGQFDEQECADGWESLRHYCGTGRESVDMHKLRRRLSADRPPIEFVLPEDKLPGPIVGTIHASKGREAPDVHLMLTADLKVDGDDLEQIGEEGRVVFVGATRPKNTLRIGETKPIYAGSLDGLGRVYKIGGKKGATCARFEFGRAGDVDQYAHLEADAWPDGPEEALEIQEYLWSEALKHVQLKAENGADTDWRYWLHAEDESCCWLGCLSENISKDFWSVGKIIASKRKLGKLRPGNRIRYLNMIGSASVVLPETDDLESRLFKPFSTTGIYLAPVITGFTNVYFNKYGGRS